jgi:hypothetical protein
MRKIFLATLLSAAFCPLLSAQQILNNDSVVKMAKAGLSDEIIVSTINASTGTYSTTPDDLIALKNAGIGEKVIAAIVSRNSPQTQSAPSIAPVGAQALSNNLSLASTNAAIQPRVYLQAQSKGTNRNAARDQSMEMSHDFEKGCSAVKVTINQNAADYTVLLNHIEVGMLVRDNQFQIANREGDLISKTSEGGSIAKGVKKACDAIMEDWGKKYPSDPNASHVSGN